MQANEKKHRVADLLQTLKDVCVVLENDQHSIVLSEPFGDDRFLILVKRMFRMQYATFEPSTYLVDHLYRIELAHTRFALQPNENDDTTARLHYDSVPRRQARTGDFWRAVKMGMERYSKRARTRTWSAMKTLRFRRAWGYFRFHRRCQRWLVHSGWINRLMRSYEPDVMGGSNATVFAESVQQAVVSLKQAGNGPQYGMYPALRRNWLEAGCPVRPAG